MPHLASPYMAAGSHHTHGCVMFESHSSRVCYLYPALSLLQGGDMGTCWMAPMLGQHSGVSALGSSSPPGSSLES